MQIRAIGLWRISTSTFKFIQKSLMTSRSESVPSETLGPRPHRRDDPPKVTEQEPLQLLWPPVKDDALIGPLRC